MPAIQEMTAMICSALIHSYTASHPHRNTTTSIAKDLVTSFWRDIFVTKRDISAKQLFSKLIILESLGLSLSSRGLDSYKNVRPLFRTCAHLSTIPASSWSIAVT